MTRIESALKKATDTKSVMIGGGALAALPDMVRGLNKSGPVLMVADANTYAAAGQAARNRLEAAGIPVSEPLVFAGKPVLEADFRRVVEVEAYLRSQAGIPLAVGSGTLNDLTKLAAYRCQRPYLVVATAASVDGYAAYGAAITHDGYKLTDPCPAPAGVLADLDVLAAAPAELTASGYGDLLGKVSAGADWLIADALGVEPIQPAAWDLIQPNLNDWLASPARLAAGDAESVAGLFEGLVLSGLAMQAIQSSRPASGSEHQFSHLWEMQGVHASHGFKVGLGSLAMAAFYQKLLEQDFERLDIAALCAAWPSPGQLEQDVRLSLASPVLAERGVEESLAKHPTPEQLAIRLRRLQQVWPALRARLSDQVWPVESMQAKLAAAGCPVDPQEIGLDEQRVKQSYSLARRIRRRYTALDLAAETGLLQTFAS